MENHVSWGFPRWADVEENRLEEEDFGEEAFFVDDEVTTKFDSSSTSTPSVAEVAHSIHQLNQLIERCPELKAECAKLPLTFEAPKTFLKSALKKGKSTLRRQSQDPGSFSKLPLEIRMNIWDDVVSVPRIVKIDVIEFNLKSTHSITFNSSTPVPAMLHINRESRNIALQYFKLLFRSDSDKLLGTEATIYFNTERDTAFFTSDFSSIYGNRSYLSHLETLQNSFPRTSNKILKVALPAVILMQDNNRSRALTNLRWHLSNLIEIIVTVERSKVAVEIESDDEGQRIQPVVYYGLEDRYRNPTTFLNPTKSEIASLQRIWADMDYGSQVVGPKRRAPLFTIKAITEA